MQAPDPLDPLTALVAGDTGPFEAFVQRQTPLFMAYFRRLGARPLDAEDLTQELMLRLFRNAKSYQGQGRLEAFAFRVARNAWIDHCRRASIRPRALGQGGVEEASDASPFEPASVGPSPEDSAISSERQDELFGLVAELGETQRDAFRMGVCEGRPYPEIAKVLGIPVGTVKSRVFHAVQKLRGQLSARADWAQEFGLELEPGMTRGQGVQEGPRTGPVSDPGPAGPIIGGNA